jgi:hypothetical protein
LGENRARFEDQRPRRDDEFDDEDGDEEMVEAGEDTVADEHPPRQERSERFNRRERPRRDDREERSSRQPADAEPRAANGGGETIPFDVLPPAISRDESETPEVSEEQPRRPRRRARAPRPADGDEEIAPAA